MADHTKLDYIAERLDGVSEKVDTINTSLVAHIVKFEAHIEREEEDRQHLARNTEVLRENTASLQDHMRRTDALEVYVKKIDERFTPVELEAMRKRAVADFIKGQVVFLAKLGGALTAVGALVGIVRFIIHSLQ
jgi:hypothetical protein